MLRQRMYLAAWLTVASILATGCSLLQVPFFLIYGEPKVDPKLKALESGKVVILTSMPGEIRPEFLRIDRELTSRLVRQMSRLNEENNKGRLEIVPSKKVEKFKDENPDWQTLDMKEIGKYFDADYVISLEILSVDLYEKGAGTYMYRGQIEIDVEVFDMKDENGEPVYDTFNVEYPPRPRGSIPSDDQSPRQFRQRFLDHVAQRLAWWFLPHTIREQYQSL
ncbi:MAG: hypothetical protein KatS3mg105_2054 [Gemmatales bacterium]|nr:MAG: hypothetical protein KatS3mg105_2054 [Gemmatales bacterium]